VAVIRRTLRAGPRTAARWPAVWAALVALGSVGGARADYQWNLPPNFPVPKVPDANPMSREKVELGRFVFYDTRLSGNQTQSCGSCHLQRLAFTDGRPVGIGSTGVPHPRNSMTLTNAAYPASYAWANPLLLTLEKQVLLPMFGDDPVELGLGGMEDVLIERFKADGRYQRMFAEAFPGAADPITVNTIVQSVACFVRTLISGDAPYDRYVSGSDEHALSVSAQRGGQLFFSERLECFHCHGAVNTFSPFTDSVTFAGYQFDDTPLHNNGLYNIDGKGGYPPDNTGLFALTQVPADMGAFKAPTLRNIALTAPYMHDGSIATLDGVLDHYAAGGRTIPDGPYAGNGSTNPYKGGFIRGFQLSPEERQDVLNFLDSLTDEAFVTAPRFADPFATASCSGDCNLDGSVTVNELVTGVSIALGTAALAACVAADADGDGVVAVNELVAAVNRALGVCPAPPSSGGDVAASGGTSADYRWYPPAEITVDPPFRPPTATGLR
jgi:cytochrome c peroxidase